MDLKRAYEILGVNQNDDFEQIKKKYKELCKKYHPDLYQDKNIKELTEEKLKEVNEAYEILRENIAGGFDENTLYWDVYKFKVENELKKYNDIRRNAQLEMDKQLNFYKKNYFTYGSLGTFLDGDEKIVINIVKKVLDTLIEAGIRSGNHNILSSRIILEKFGNEILSDYWNLRDYYKDIIENMDMEREYKHNYKKTVDILKGRDNLGTKTIRGISNLSNSIADSEKKKEIYNDSKTFESFKISVEKALLNCIDIITDITKTNIKIEQNDIFVESILDNLEKFDVTMQKQKFFEALQLNPYNRKIYLKMLNKYGDIDNKLQNFADYFGIDLEQEKENLIISYEELFKKESKEDIKKAKENFYIRIKRLGKNEKDYINLVEDLGEINQAQNEYDEKEKLKNALLGKIFIRTIIITVIVIIISSIFIGDITGSTLNNILAKGSLGALIGIIGQLPTKIMRDYSKLNSECEEMKKTLEALK